MRLLLTLLAAVALVAGLAAPAGADAVAEPPSPGVIGPAPAPGAVVPAGRISVGAFLNAKAGVHSAEMKLDGQGIAAQRDTSSVTYQRIWADLDLAVGDHVVEVFLTDGNGASTGRAWRFTVTDVPVWRLFGDGRIQTAVRISQDLFPGGGPGARGAVLATADDFPDALAGAPVAASVGGPLLLTSRDDLLPIVADELRRLLTPGSIVNLLGGPSALTERVADQVRAAGFNVRRIEGVDRYDTSVAAARQLALPREAFVASGVSFPDALAASSPAARDGMPILLTLPDGLPGSVREYLSQNRMDRIYVVGGQAVVSDAVEQELRGFAGEVIRLAGDGRFHTAAAVADRFFERPATVAVASGASFPDALAGGPHAAQRGAPMLLSPQTNLARQQVDALAGEPPSNAYLYGGPAVLWDTVAGDVQRASLDGNGPRETELSPAPGDEINSFDTLSITFDRDLRLEASSVFVTLDGREVYGTVAQGDFPNSLVFRAGALPIDAASHTPYPVRVVVLAHDGTAWRHLEYNLVFKKLDLSRGDAGAQVRAVQDRLTALGYWLGTPDGTYGSLMTQAVMAFQKAEGLDRTGSVDTATRQRLEVAGRAQPRHRHSGHYVEIDKTRQIMMIIDNGVATYTFNTSTGHGRYYNENGHSGYAVTPEGTFTFFRQINGMRESDLGQMWRPKYFTERGHAIHGSTSIPAYPASHGCARLSYPAIDHIWDANLVPIGTRLYVYS